MKVDYLIIILILLQIRHEFFFREISLKKKLASFPRTTKIAEVNLTKEEKNATTNE